MPPSYRMEWTPQNSTRGTPRGGSRRASTPPPSNRRPSTPPKAGTPRRSGTPPPRPKTSDAPNTHMTTGGDISNFTSASGLFRDHAVVKDDSVRQKLAAAADKAQAYRSAEQKYNDHRQATGFQPAGPLAFGQYEVGRSSMPEHCFSTWQFKNAGHTDAIYHHPDGCEKIQDGDPGAYDPYTGTSGQFTWSCLADRTYFTHAQDAPAFNSSEVRDVGKVRGLSPGLDSPGPAGYHPAANIDIIDHHINPCHSCFGGPKHLKGSLQRPTSHTINPDMGRYNPNFKSVDVNMPDGGFSFRNTSAQAAKPLKSQTDEALGPGAYNDYWNSIQHNLDQLKRAQSRHKPGFGTKAPQRALPFEYGGGQNTGGVKADCPDPGSYQPTVWSGPKPGTRRKSARSGGDGR